MPRGCVTPATRPLPCTTPLADPDAGHHGNTDGATPTAAAPGPLEFAKYLREKYPLLVCLPVLFGLFTCALLINLPIHLIRLSTPVMVSQVEDEITMIIKQQYSRGLMHLTQASNSIHQVLLQARNGLQMDMYKFSDKVINSVSTRCLCCRARGFADCPASGCHIIRCI